MRVCEEGASVAAHYQSILIVKVDIQHHCETLMNLIGGNLVHFWMD